MIRSILFGVFLLFAGSVLGQDHFKYLSTRIHYGSVIIHSRELRPVKDSYPLGLELDFGKHKISEKAWNSCNCFPKTGISLTFWDFDNREVLGHGLTAMYYVQAVFGARSKLSFSVRGAMGLSYQNNPYNLQSNPDNQSYSTYLAFPLQLGVAIHYKLNNRWKLDLNMVYNHISNGGMKEPNKGINWPSFGLGLSRYFKEVKFPDRIKTNWRNEVINKHRKDISLFGTYHEPESKLFLISAGLELKYARRISRLNNVTIASEWMYDNGQTRLSTKENRVNGNILGLAAGNEFILGKFLFGQQLAAYLIKPNTRFHDLYQRYSLLYRISNSFLAGVSLKAHGHVADFLDLRLGYSF